MFKKLRNVEKKFYEIIGIKIFRKMAFALRIFLFSFNKLSKEERKRILNEPSNYNMKKGNGIQDLKDFKWMLVFNTSIHLWGIYLGLPIIEKILYGSYTIVQKVLMAIPMFINTYCIMLQRYNLIRIHEAEEKYAKLQELKEKREKRLEEKREKKKNELTIERINELISIFNVTPVVEDEVEDNYLQEQGYSKVVDAKSFFINTESSDPFNPDYWLNVNKDKAKTLTRKVG